MSKFIIALCLALAQVGRSEELEIRPSVWGTEKWYGGYELYQGDRLVGEAKASVWGQDKWYGGYKVETKERSGTKLFEKFFKEK